MIYTYDFQKNKAAHEWFSDAVNNVAGCYTKCATLHSQLPGMQEFRVLVDTHLAEADEPYALIRIIGHLYRTAIRLHS